MKTALTIVTMVLGFVVTSGQESPQGSPGPDDAQFVADAAGVGMAEVELGRLAAERGNGAEVKAFGQMMVDDHGKANAELATLASRMGVGLPSAPPEAARTEREGLNNLTGSAFDAAYLKAMVDGHQRALELFTREVKSGTDPELKAWAAKVVPTIKGHLTTAQNLQPRH
jgi:putative membrane protein